METRIYALPVVTSTINHLPILKNQVCVPALDLYSGFLPSTMVPSSERDNNVAHGYTSSIVNVLGWSSGSSGEGEEDEEEEEDVIQSYLRLLHKFWDWFLS